jgi:hypothetical protein
VAGKADPKMAILAVKGITNKDTKSIGIVKVNLADFIHKIDVKQEVEASLERCPDKTAKIKF